jgi:hypothetical protein
VTSLSATVERLVMIGDHKQLRPKVNLYVSCRSSQPSTGRFRAPLAAASHATGSVVACARAHVSGSDRRAFGVQSA